MFATPLINTPVHHQKIPVDQIKREILKQLPKYNSHCHLGGEIPLCVIEKYATKEQIEAIKRGFEEIAKGKDYEKGFFIFPLISQVINTLERLKEGAYQTCERMKKDNNQLVLMRTGLKSLENKPLEEYLKAVLEGVEQAASDKFKAFLMLSLKRSSTPEMTKLTIDLALKYRERGVVGIDISDSSVIGDITAIIPELKRAKQEGLKIAVHIGESIKETDQMLIIDNLQPDLIDHGVNLCSEAIEWIEKNQVPVTICPTSSIATKMHQPDTLHPWVKHHLKSNHPIDLGTDDSTVFGNITLSDEFFRLNSDVEFAKIVNISKASFARANEWFKS